MTAQSSLSHTLTTTASNITHLPHTHTKPKKQESAPFLRVLGSYPMDLELGVVDSDKPPGFEAVA